MSLTVVRMEEALEALDGVHTGGSAGDCGFEPRIYPRTTGCSSQGLIPMTSRRRARNI